MDAFPDPGPDALVYILSHDPEPLPTIRAFVEAFGVDQLHRLQLRNDIADELWDQRVKVVCVDCEDPQVAIDLAASGLEWLVVDLQARAAREREGVEIERLFASAVRRDLAYRWPGC